MRGVGGSRQSSGAAGVMRGDHLKEPLVELKANTISQEQLSEFTAADDRHHTRHLASFFFSSKRCSSSSARLVVNGIIMQDVPEASGVLFNLTCGTSGIDVKAI